MRGEFPREICYNRNMNLEEIKKRLRTPQKTIQEQSRQSAAVKTRNQQAQGARSWLNFMPMIALVVTIVALFVSIIFILVSKFRADDIAASLDPSLVKGLSIDKEFKPSTGVRYVEIQEGRDRSVNVTTLGTTIPVISRFNLKTLNSGNYNTIGAAPWALTSNIAANLDSPDVIAYLLARKEMIEAFMARPDVSNLLNDPIELKLFVEDKAAMDEFFQDETVRRVFADKELLRVFSASPFMRYMLDSRSGRYYRSHPQEAAKIINSNEYLRELKKNMPLRQAMLNNAYLKKAVPILFK